MNSPLNDNRRAANGRLVKENFAEWFGASQVVSDDGSPLVVYHGNGADFQEFKTSGGKGKSFDTGAFFTSSTSVANSYASGLQPNVMPVYLRLITPVVIDAMGLNWNSIAQKCKVQMPSITVATKQDQEIEDLAAALEDRAPEVVKPTWRRARATNVRAMFKGEWDYPSDTASTDDIARWARRHGYDGLIIRNVVDRGPNGIHDAEVAKTPGTIYVAFDPSQIKSAIGNSGLYLASCRSTTDHEEHMALMQAKRARSEVAKLMACLRHGVTP